MIVDEIGTDNHPQEYVTHTETSAQTARHGVDSTQRGKENSTRVTQMLGDALIYVSCSTTSFRTGSSLVAPILTAMSQFELFNESEPRVIIDSHRGRVVYTPHLVSDDTADRWYDVLAVSEDWRIVTRRMYDKEVLVPRLIASYRISEALPDVIAEMVAVVAEHVSVTFTSVQLNFYRDKHDSVSPHGDSLDELEVGSPIVLISLGGTRTMVIKEIHPGMKPVSLQLEHGSLLEMDYEMQKNYTHAIPKVTYHVDPRISVVFRKHNTRA